MRNSLLRYFGMSGRQGTRFTSGLAEALGEIFTARRRVRDHGTFDFARIRPRRVHRRQLRMIVRFDFELLGPQAIVMREFVVLCQRACLLDKSPFATPRACRISNCSGADLDRGGPVALRNTATAAVLSGSGETWFKREYKHHHVERNYDRALGSTGVAPANDCSIRSATEFAIQKPFLVQLKTRDLRAVSSKRHRARAGWFGSAAYRTPSGQSTVSPRTNYRI